MQYPYPQQLYYRLPLYYWELDFFLFCTEIADKLLYYYFYLETKNAFLLNSIPIGVEVGGRKRSLTRAGMNFPEQQRPRRPLRRTRAPLYFEFSFTCHRQPLHRLIIRPIRHLVDGPKTSRCGPCLLR